MTITAKRRGRVLGRPEPDYDPCFMPLGSGTSCCLPGTHVGGCLPPPAGYPPVVTVAAAR